MPLHTIQAPVPFTGVGPGRLRFVAGRSQSEDEDTVNWYRTAGYVIDGQPKLVEALGGLAPDWTPDSTYDAGELVWREGLLRRRKVAGQDGAAFDQAQWDTLGGNATSGGVWNGSAFVPTPVAQYIGPVNPASHGATGTYLWWETTA